MTPDTARARDAAALLLAMARGGLLVDIDPTNPAVSVIPWPIYSHFCAKCDYLILESEWNTVTDPTTTTPEPAAGVADTPHVVTEDDGEPD